VAVRSGAGVAFRIAITGYAAGLAIWLLLGLLPPLAEHVAAVHHLLASTAETHSPLASPAQRVLHPDTMADTTTATQTGIQYAFSALNLLLGLLLVVRRPDETVPRLLGFALLGTAATFNLPSHRAFHITGEPWPIAAIHFTFHIVSGVSYIWAVALFPDGRLPRRIRIGRRATMACAVVFTALAALVCWRSSFLAHPQFFVTFFGIAVPVFGLSAQQLRLRDAQTTTIERRTARMLSGALLPAFAAGLLWVGARVISALSRGREGAAAARFADHTATWFPVVFAVVPVVLLAAVLRYRLWDLDRWLSRVLVYALLGIALGAAYVLAVTASSLLARPGSLWILAVVLSVAVTATEPLRRRARRWSNRVLFGVALSPQEALRALTDGLSRLSPAGERDQLVEVAVRATRADLATLWLLNGSQLVAVASEPKSDRTTAPMSISRPPGQPDAVTLELIQRVMGPSFCSPVRHQHELLGVLAIAGRAGAGLPRRDRAMVADIAEHAGLVVRNAMLTEDLAAHAVAQEVLSGRLRQARRRLVAAQDAERRRLERNLHDGAQQALVATLLGLRALVPEPVEAARGLAELGDIIAIARASLVELTSARYPAVLTEAGLTGAIEQVARLTRQLGIDVLVSSDIDEDVIDPDVGLATYFCCAEALQNVAKYADATAVTIALEVIDGDLLFAVTDDGAGFDVATAAEAGGLSQLDARLAAVGGVLTVQTRAGGGTRVSGRAPTRAPAAVG
jgi:signal transduction histidine kinase